MQLLDAAEEKPCKTEQVEPGFKAQPQKLLKNPDLDL